MQTVKLLEDNLESRISSARILKKCLFPPLLHLPLAFSCRFTAQGTSLQKVDYGPKLWNAYRLVRLVRARLPRVFLFPVD